MPTLRGLLWVVLPGWVPDGVCSLLLIFGTLAGLLWAAKGLRGVTDGPAFDMAFATAVAAVALVSFHSLPHDLSLMILPLLAAAGVFASADLREESGNPYTCVTLGFLLFFTPLYFVLIFAEKVGLLVLPAVIFLWLIGNWGRSGLPAPAARNRRVEPISIPIL
jgi:hypothetical protein